MPTRRSQGPDPRRTSSRRPAGVPTAWPGLAAALSLALLAAAPLRAHAGLPPEPHDLWRAWSPEPAVLLGVGAALWLYARGTGRLWRRAGVGRGVPRWRLHAFAAGLAALLLALVSPLDALGSALFSAHMVQHELLMLAAAPLLALGAPAIPLLWALPPRLRAAAGRWSRAPAVRRPWRALTHPLSAWLLQAAVVWLWHAPALYQRALTSEPVHVLQHASFLGAAVLFWESLLRGVRRSRAGYGVGVLSLFATAGYGSLLGALLTFASAPWYPAYGAAAAPWGLTPLEDQQLGGLIMWVPFGLVHVGAALALFAGWMRASERRARVREAAPDASVLPCSRTPALVSHSSPRASRSARGGRPSV